MSKRPAIEPGPRVRWVPKAKTNDAEDAIFLATAYGMAPDEWQADILRGWLGRKANGKWAAGRCGIAVPRQNGKNAAIEIRELFGMIELGEQILHTAHEVKTARKAFKRLKHFFGESVNDPAARYPDLNALVKEVRNTNGQEAIVLKDIVDDDGTFVRRGGSVEFVARSKGSGRGFTVDVLILDEAQALADDELEAIRSAVSSAPLGNAQVIYAGTPPNRDLGQAGEVFIRVRAGAGKDKRLSWIEYGAPDGPLPDLNDTALLYAANPALDLRHANGAYGLQMDVIKDELGDLSPHGYARERLGWWGDPETKHEGVIKVVQWAGLKVSTTGAPKRIGVVIDVSPNLEWAAIAVAADVRDSADGQPSRVDVPGGRTLMLIDHVVGIGGVAEKVIKLIAGRELVGEVGLTPNAHIYAAKLTKAKVPHKVLTPTEIGRGCTATQEWVRDGSIAHVGQPVLDAAVRNARTKFVGDTQHWDQRDRSIDNTPLVAGSIAVQRFRLLSAAPDKTPAAPVADEVVDGDDDMAAVFGSSMRDLNDVQF